MARPKKPYRTSWGEHVNGLRRHTDGRWIICETGKTFAEADERLAVARFKRWEAEHEQRSVPMDAGIVYGVGMETGTGEPIYRRRIQAADIPEADLWAYVREQLISRPEYAATMTGIAELARLADLPKREPSPTLQAVGDLYQSKATAVKHYKRQQRRFWDDFAACMTAHGAGTLRQLTATLVAEYGDEARQRNESAATTKHRFTGIRGVISFARKRGMNADDCRHALDCCAVLTAPPTNSNDPHPISRDDFRKMLDNATEPRMRAALLTMLNLCMYPGEALALNWDDLDLANGTVVTRRPKTGVIRIGVLWKRTADALTAIKPSKPRGDAPVFISREGTRWHGNTLGHHFRKLREASGVAVTIESRDLRDGAYTAAVESGAELNQAKLLAGHSTGISDKYAMRKPTMVADACAAIEQTYFG